MKLNDKFLGILLFLAVTFLTIFSLVFDKFLQLVLFAGLAFILAYLFVIFQKIILVRFQNLRQLYFSVLFVILISVSILFSILYQTYDLISIATYIFLIFGGMVVALMLTKNWKIELMKFESMSLLGMNKFQESLDYSDKILELYPEDYGAMLLKSYAFHMMGKYPDVLALSDGLIENTKDLERKLEALNLKAYALLKLEKYNEAEEIVDYILEKDPANEGALADKSRILSNQGKYPEAIEYYEDSLEIYAEKILKYRKSKIHNGKVLLPDNMLNYTLGGIWINKGEAHQKLQQYNEALKCYNKAIELNPDFEHAINAKKEVEQLLTIN